MHTASTTPAGIVSSVNSSTTPLAAGATFTGEAEDVSAFDSMTVAPKTDQNGTYTIQFSPDGTNWDSTLTRYYRTDQIEPPHRFTIARRFARVTFQNTSSSPQTYLRLQVMYGSKQPLNTPLDAVVAQDYDATMVRGINFAHEVALGLRQGVQLWNKFGYNLDIDTAAAEVVASWGGSFTPLTTATTLSVVSTDATDDDGAAGANTVTITGLDANRNEQTVVVTMDGTTPVVTAETWLGINRMRVASSGATLTNAGTITATAVTGGTTQGQIPAGKGTSKQAIFHVPASHRGCIDFIKATALKISGGGNPVVTATMWVFDPDSNTKYEAFTIPTDTTVDNHVILDLPLPYPLSPKQVVWFDGATTVNDSTLNIRFSLLQYRNVEA